MILAALLIFISGLILLWQSSRIHRASGLPAGKIIYTDTRPWRAVEQPLFDAGLGLTGRPDYLVEKGGEIIPVEVKSGSRPEAPYESHIYQLAAYCLLVERVHGRRPSHGILHYGSPNQAAGNPERRGRQRSFAIEFTPTLEKAILDLLGEMQRVVMQDKDRSQGIDRSHQSAARCRACGFRSRCDQALA